MNIEQKYLKYKNKYLRLKYNLKGGAAAGIAAAAGGRTIDNIRIGPDDGTGTMIDLDNSIDHYFTHANMNQIVNFFTRANIHIYKIVERSFNILTIKQYGENKKRKDRDIIEGMRILPYINGLMHHSLYVTDAMKELLYKADAHLYINGLEMKQYGSIFLLAKPHFELYEENDGSFKKSIKLSTSQILADGTIKINSINIIFTNLNLHYI